MDPSVSYRHLDSKLRLGELTFGQWGCVAAGVLAAIGYALYLPPFGAYVTLATAVYLAGIPALLALIASLYEVRLARRHGRPTSGQSVSQIAPSRSSTGWFASARAPVVLLTSPATGRNAPCGPRVILPLRTS